MWFICRQKWNYKCWLNECPLFPVFCFKLRPQSVLCKTLFDVWFGTSSIISDTVVEKQISRLCLRVHQVTTLRPTWSHIHVSDHTKLTKRKKYFCASWTLLVFIARELKRDLQWTAIFAMFRWLRVAVNIAVQFLLPLDFEYDEWRRNFVLRTLEGLLKRFQIIRQLHNSYQSVNADLALIDLSSQLIAVADTWGLA